MRTLAIYFAAALLAGATPAASHAADIEKAQAIDGTSGYGVVYGAVDNVNRTSSAIRFYNGSLSAATFEMTIVNVSTGAQVGNTKSFTMTANESQIYFISTLLGSQFVNATVTTGQVYAVYIKSSERLAGYQHILYNGNTDLFENPTVCTTPYNQTSLASNNSIVLLNIPTTKLPQYPGIVLIHNVSAVAVNLNLTVFSSVTASAKGDIQVTIQPNRSYSNTITNLQNSTSWSPSTDELWAHVVITDSNGGAPQVLASTLINNTALQGNIGLTTACAINAPISTAISATTTFDGSIASGSQTGTFSVTVQGSGTSSSASEDVKATKASIEKPQVNLTAAGTLLIGGNTITLTGTYDSVTRKLLLNGGSYSFIGAIMGAVTYFGTYTGPGGASGGFSGSKSSSTKSRGFCGSLSGHDNDGPVNATFSLVVAGDGTFAGYAADAGGGVRLTGTVNGTSLVGYGVDSAGYGANISGTISGNSLTGTYGGNDTEGTFTATSCGAF